MSTIDSYSLVAGANFAYDLYRPLVKPNVSDRELVRLTRVGILLSWTLGFGLAFLFDRLMALWVFMSTLLTSTVLVPIFVALYWKGRKTAAGGVSSCAAGMVGVIVYYVLLQQLGVANEAYGTYIWTFEIWTFELGGVSFSLWREYALFFSLPVSLAGFLVGNRFGPAHPAPVAPEQQELRQ
jgi:Na+/proline symporter